MGFDERNDRKNGLYIVTAVCNTYNEQNEPILLRAHEMVYNPGSTVSLMSEYQV